MNDNGTNTGAIIIGIIVVLVIIIGGYYLFAAQPAPTASAPVGTTERGPVPQTIVSSTGATTTIP